MLPPLPLCGAVAISSTVATAFDVERLVSEALEAHPHVVQVDLQADAARHRVAPAGAWEDPRLEVGVQNLPYDPFSLNATPMSGVRVGLSQRFPWPGKRPLAEAAARAGAEVAKALSEEARNELSAEVRGLYYDLHLIDVSARVIETNLQIVARFIELADAKYRVGAGRQQDFLRARVAKSELEESHIGIEAKRASLLARLSERLARAEPLALGPQLDVAISLPNPALDGDALANLAEAHRPLLHALAGRVEGAQARADLADKAALPDLGVSLAYTFRGDAGGLDPVNGADFLSLGMSVGLPVFHGRKQGPASEAAQVDHSAAQAAVRSARLEIRGVIDEALATLPRLEAQMAKYADEIIPTTAQALEADLTSYQVDKASVLDVLDAQMRLVRYQTDYHRLHVAHEKLVVRLAYAVGVDPREIARRGPHAHVHGGTP